MPCRGVLNGERMNTTVMTSNLQPSMGKAHSPHKIYVGQESFDSYKIRVSVSVLQVLTRHLHFIEFLKFEFTQVRTIKL